MTQNADAPTTIVWFRNDLRLSDNPALDAALKGGHAVLPVFILEEEAPGDMALGGASRWWLHHSLVALAKDLEAAGAPLHLRRGRAEDILPDLAQRAGAARVTWNRRYEPWAIDTDARIKAALKQDDIAAESFNGALLYEPWEVKTKQGGWYGVFTPFWKAECALGDPAPPLPTPRRIAGAATDALPAGDDLADWGLSPTGPDWAGGLRNAWTPGEAGARDRLDRFLSDGVAAYPDTRDRPDREGTSRLSPHLHFGEISPRQIWHWSLDRLRAEDGPAMERGVWAFLREVGWRDFNHNLLYHNPGMPHRNYQTKFDAFPWRDDDAGLRAWQRGRTGYPLVDAGMRELWETGYMHNRVRMLVASFLVKDLLIPWQRGEAWFRDTLVDADLANNVANWQWTAGCGADAAPYFRIFNPVTQGEKFDPDGDYVRRWIPELAKLPAKSIHAPWTADAKTLAAAGVTLGRTYPRPIVDHKTARQQALDAYEDVKGAA
ncbi:deoxyribodipyrimidine photo-lyase [Marivibrio halodurans]|uniref:Deoxyribodipyrimidine photo-lyase n=1 Tax=Marivibrio halodurans TaxID=2039722 RepID=A0A8J7S824_9PROT|nr:deoxyribodipyrimidine photo-lyase [Marivibrio halodurans]MBP5857197.1 deoxyribodipyrimidine photo-lyase [Marivibrio halodurans]